MFGLYITGAVLVFLGALSTNLIVKDATIRAVALSISSFYLFLMIYGALNL